MLTIRDKQKKRRIFPHLGTGEAKKEL